MAFEVPTLAAIVARCRADFRSEAGIDPLRRSIESALIRALAGQSKGQYAYATYLGEQAFLDRADETHFWRWAAIWGIYQEAATPWTGTVRFTGTNTTVIPIGTEIARSDGQLYTTDAAGTIALGIADIAVTASVEGADGNNDDAQALTLSTPIAGIDSTCTVTSTDVDGADVESQADGLTRLLAQIQTPPSGGGTGDYVRLAREVAGVTRAWETSLGAGSVSVAFVRDNDGSGAAILPDAGELAEVLAHVQAGAPITVTVSVVTLTALTVNVTLSALVPNTTAVHTAITAELTDFFAREGSPGGTINLSRLNEAISAAAGETTHVMSVPAADVTATSTQVPILGTITFP